MTDSSRGPSDHRATRSSKRMSRRRRQRLARTVIFTGLIFALIGFLVAQYVPGSNKTRHSSLTTTGPRPTVVTTRETTSTTPAPPSTARKHTPPPTTTVVTSPPPPNSTSISTSASTSTTRPATTQSSCPQTGIGQPTYNGAATQLITVNASSGSDTSAELVAWTRSGSCWRIAYGPFDGARVGYNGMSADKHEGDGTTPEGIYGIGSTMYGNAPDPGVHAAYHDLVCGDWWDEDSVSPTYNTFQHVPCSETDPPFNNGSSEALWKETSAYPSFAVIEYNTARVPGAGSAIFLHADIGSPTDGCVSLPLSQLDEVLDWIEPGDTLIDIGLTSEVIAP
jgi:L,D-peptidoglycan transpeptidase YkuD (ErfK/YbiS/YcfS/YnhG family)